MEGLYHCVFALQTTPGSFLLLPVGLHVRPTHSPRQPQHQANLPLCCWIFNKFSVFFSKTDWCLKFKNRTARTWDTAKWYITSMPISVIYLFFIAELSFRAQKEDNYMICFRMLNQWMNEQLPTWTSVHTTYVRSYESFDTTWFSCMFLRSYGSLILGLQKIIHTVVINNKTLILLSLGCVKAKVEYVCIQYSSWHSIL